MEERIRQIDNDGGLEAYVPENGFTTLKDMALEYIRKHPNEKFLNATIKAFSHVARRDFGKYPKGTGPKGMRYTCWVKIVNHAYLELSKEERKIVSKIYDRYFSKEAKSAEIAGVIEGELTEHEYVEADKMRYLAFIDEAAQALGVEAIKTVTKFDFNAWSKEKQEGKREELICGPDR